MEHRLKPFEFGFPNLANLRLNRNYPTNTCDIRVLWFQNFWSPFLLLVELVNFHQKNQDVALLNLVIVLAFDQIQNQKLWVYPIHNSCNYADLIRLLNF